MHFWRRPLFLLFLCGVVSSSGCRTSHANPAPAWQSPAKSQSPAAPASKHPPRDSAFSIYKNPAYGVSFRYPRNYLLDEDFDSEDPYTLQAQQELAVRQPGSILVATVNIPPDAYPNTTFRSGSLRLVVNPAVTPEICQSFVAPTDPDAHDTVGTSTINGVLFHWWESGEFASHMDYSTRVYTAFVRGACYEFHLEVTDSASMVPEPSEKPVDSDKILRQLDKIVSSLQLHPAQPPPHPLSFRAEQANFFLALRPGEGLDLRSRGTALRFSSSAALVSSFVQTFL